MDSITRTAVSSEDAKNNKEIEELKKLLENPTLFGAPDFFERILEVIDIENNHKKDGKSERNTEVRKLLSEHVENSVLGDNPDERIKFKQKIKLLNMPSIVEPIRMLWQDIDEAFKDVHVHTYKLLDNSPFKVLSDPEVMVLGNGLVTIGGKASSGKTSFITHLATEIMRGNDDTCFIFFSLDDTRAKGTLRIASQILEKSYLRPGLPSPMDNQDSKAKLGAFFKHIAIFESRERCILEQIKPTINAIQQLKNYKNTIVCFDYLQLIESEKGQHGSDRRASLNNCLGEIKKIQKDTNSLFILLSQLKRGGKGEDHEYRESSEIENVSDVCIDIKYTEETEKGRASNERHITISKNKTGKSGQVYTTSINENLMFSELKPKNYDLTNNPQQKYQVRRTTGAQSEMISTPSWDDLKSDLSL